MNKVEKAIKKILIRLYPWTIQADVKLIQLDHKFELIDDETFQNISFPGIRSFRHSGIEVLTIRFRRKYDSPKE